LYVLMYFIVLCIKTQSLSTPDHQSSVKIQSRFGLLIFDV